MEKDLTNRENVVALMKSSKSEQEWNVNCDKVKAANNGYPAWWYQEIIIGGVQMETVLSW